MTRTSTRIVVVALLSLLCQPAVAADRMTHIVFRLISPKIKSGTFAAATKEMWRVGTHYLRLEEQPDPKRGIQGLIVTNEPDTWMINLFTGTGRHFVDPGPSLTVHAALFPFIKDKRLARLEYGREAAFFTQHKAKPVGKRTLDGVTTEASAVTLGDATVTLYRRPDGRPVQVSLRSPKAKLSVRYETYEQGLTPDWGLFKRPLGFQITEPKPHRESPH